MPDLSQIHPFLVSLVIGLLVGIERERSHPRGTQAAGVRTFMLIGILGTLVSHVGDSAFSLSVSFLVGVLILAGYWRTSVDLGLTTEVSALVVYGLGFLTHEEPFLALLVGVVVAAILFSRHWLHHFSREILRPPEIRSVLTLAVLFIGVVPFLPDRPLDPWEVFNPRKLAMVISLLAFIQFASYVSARILGRKIGLILAGFFGGLISSTSVFATLPARVRDQPDLLFSAVATAVVAVLAMLIELFVIVAVSAPQLLTVLAAPLALMGVIGFATTIAFASFAPNTASDLGESASPLDWRAVFKLSSVVCSVLVIVSLMQRFFGHRAFQATIFLGSLFELHGITFSVANMFTQSQLSEADALDALTLAIGGAFLAKIALLCGLNRGRLALYTLLSLIPMMSAGAIAVWLIRG